MAAMRLYSCVYRYATQAGDRGSITASRQGLSTPRIFVMANLLALLPIQFARNHWHGWAQLRERRCALSGRGLIADSELGLTEALWVGPENKGIYIGSPSIWKCVEGMSSRDSLGRAHRSTTQILVDPTGHGAGSASRWGHAGNLTGMYWGNVFSHPFRQHELYMLGVSSGAPHGSRGIVIAQSLNLGSDWSAPVTLFPASSSDGSYHCAPTPTLVASDGRLYRAFETSVPNAKRRLQALMIFTVKPVSATTNLLDPDVWGKQTVWNQGWQRTRACTS